MKYKKIKTKQEFLSLIIELLDENENAKWENNNVYDFLQAMASWLNDSESFYKNLNIDINTEEASWQLFADLLQAASVYE